MTKKDNNKKKENTGNKFEIPVKAGKCYCVSPNFKDTDINSNIHAACGGYINDNK